MAIEKMILVSIFVLAGLLDVAFAKRFTSQYTEFELPPGWQCALEGTEWVCQSENEERKKEAIIILAAKIRGPQDSLDQYQAYLKGQKTFTLPGGRTQVSEAKTANVKTINDHQWVDALHLASEVPGFYTRYLATVKEDLGVAVTFSVAKDHYSSYQSIFDNIVATLRVFRQKAASGDMALKKKDENLLDDSTFIPDQGANADIANQKKKAAGGGLSTSDLMLYGGVGLALLVGLMIAKKKKK
ncbi:MAG: hypothetical protein A2X86_11350 [Bdellovibrionales bacterium GWA2_49_15]|nr:MAG: hypothetical protein A2X86_11350 [Bdellovibrionales bacterium GWA2_49_15]HAZ12654.1 hypothetical protein [Bdellovibrionales bacterium]